jgi:ribulose-phosphate 3-epimerase
VPTLSDVETILLKENNYMTHTIQVVPAIIPHTKEQLEEEIKKVVGFSDLVQIDISDGVFVPVKSWPYNGHDTDFFEALKTEEIGWPKWEELEFEIHLMIKNPEETLLDWIHTGASSIVAHIEATENFQKVIDLCREHAVSVGVAIKPATDIARLEPFTSQVDFIQVMGSDMVGKHGVALDDTAVEKIRALRGLYPERIIAIDIGVNEETAEILVQAGANKLISGGAILEADDPEEVYSQLEAIN